MAYLYKIYRLGSGKISRSLPFFSILFLFLRFTAEIKPRPASALQSISLHKQCSTLKGSSCIAFALPSLIPFNTTQLFPSKFHTNSVDGYRQ